jgi:uncharacterized repeat protein (TIGR01451 family)
MMEGIMALNRILALPLVIGGIVTGAAIPALGATSIPLPTAPYPLLKSGPVAVPGLAAVPGPKKAAPKSAVLAISVGAATTPYKAGAGNEYTVLVRNTGTAEASNVPVLLALPPSAKFVAADAGGIAEYSGVVWIVDIKPMQQVALHAEAIAGRSAQDIEAVAATACALKTTATKQVCASALLPVIPQAMPAVVIKPQHAVKDHRGHRFGRRIRSRR